MIASVLLSVAAMIAGKPVNVACDADTNFGPTGPPPPGFVIEAWTPYGGDTIHMLPQLCADTTASPGSIEFAIGMRVLMHEAGHARGTKSEACAERGADLGIWRTLRLFSGYNTLDMAIYNVVSASIAAQILELTRLRPSNYQPEGCTES